VTKNVEPHEVRPLAQRFPRRREGELVFMLPDREVTVAGDPDLAWNVLERCDGTRTVEGIAVELGADGDDARALVDRLLREEVLVDCTQAYRLAHEQASAGSPLFRSADDADLADLRASRPRPAALGDARIAIAPRTTQLQSVVARRRSAEPGPRREVEFDELSAVLAATCGRGGRAVTPSAGALYPLLVHITVRRPLDPLGPGVWWFDPDRAEVALVDAAVPALKHVILPLPVTDALLAAGEPVIFVSADLERMSRKYANRGYRYALLEAGAAMQNAYLAAAELELPIRAVGGFDDAVVHRLLRLDGGSAALLGLLLGR
jgi:SagB-type dehydrogenase family enzyme